MDVNKLKKPEHLADDTWRNHLDWMNVGGKQVEQNFSQHEQRVKQDEGRKQALRDRHEAALKGERRTHSLFCTSTHSRFRN